MREIRQIRDSSGRIVTTQEEIANTLVDYFQRKYQPIAIDVVSMGTLINAIPTVEHGTYAEHLERPVSAEELHEAIKMGSRKRTPEIDGISLEFYLANWDLIWPDLLELFNNMFLTNSITANQNRGIIVCIKKDGEDKTPDGYQPITLLTNEYKILARILAGRLKQIVQDNITSNQSCGVPERSILEAVATVRDTIAYAESHTVPMSILTLDFQQAFDRVSHQYLFQVLRQYGISEWFTARV
jgi:hypothetical protein